MTETLATAIVSARGAVIVCVTSLVLNNKPFGGINERFDEIDRRLDNIDRILELIQADMKAYKTSSL